MQTDPQNPLALQSDKAEYQENFFGGEQGGETLEVVTFLGDHILSVDSYTKPPLRLSRSENNVIRLFGSESWLIRFDSNGYSLQFDHRTSGFYQFQDGLVSLEEARQKGMAIPRQRFFSLAIDEHSKIQLEIDNMTVLLHLTQLPEQIGTHYSFDKSALPYLGLSGFGHFLMLFLAMLVPESARAMDLDGYESSHRFVQVSLEEKIETLETHGEESPDLSQARTDEYSKSKSAPAERVDQKKWDGDGKQLGLKFSIDRSIATSAGIAPLLGGAPFGGEEHNIASDLTGALALMSGVENKEPAGLAGLSVTGSGRRQGNERGVGIDGLGIKFFR